MEIYSEKEFMENQSISMSLDEIKLYCDNKDMVYLMIKRKDDKGVITVCGFKSVINCIMVSCGMDNEVMYQGLSIHLCDNNPIAKNELAIDLKQIQSKFIILRNKPDQKYVKISTETIVPTGYFCGICQYCRNEKMFIDECGKHHNGSCLLFLTYLDYDKEIGEMRKCSKCLMKSK